MDQEPGTDPLVDAHVHLWGLGDSDSGIWINPRYRRSLKFLGNGLLLGMHWRKESYDSYYLKLLLKDLQGSPIERAVLQGMEGVYDASGRLDRRRSAIFVPNEYTYRVCREHPQLVPAAAISPARADWEEQLEKAAENGAVYVKLNPCVGNTPAADVKWRPYYQKIRKLGLVLMCHTGPERAVSSWGKELGDPAGLELPLSEGLVVVASHAATGTPLEGAAFFENMVRLMEKYENMYADTSAVAQAPRWKWLRRIAQHQLVRSRLLHGSDYPVPLTLLPWGVLNFSSWWSLRRLRSRLARDYYVKEAAGYGQEAARRAARVLNIT